MDLLAKENWPRLLLNPKRPEYLWKKSLRRKGVSEDDILNAKSEISGLAVRKFCRAKFLDVLKKIPGRGGAAITALLLGHRRRFFEVGAADPTDIEAKRALQFIVSRMNLPIKTFIVSEGDLETVLEEYKGLGGEVSRALGDLEMELSDVSSAALTAAMQKELSSGGSKDSKIVEDAPVTKIVAVILRHRLKATPRCPHRSRFRQGEDKIPGGWRYVHQHRSGSIYP